METWGRKIVRLPPEPGSEAKTGYRTKALSSALFQPPGGEERRLIHLRKLVLIMIISGLLLVSVSGLVMARATNWRPPMNSPADVKGIHEVHGQQAYEQVPDNPWEVGYPADTVPDHPFPGDHGK